MKVICIDGQWESLNPGDTAPDIKLGEVLNVAHTTKHLNIDWYWFEEYGKYSAYDQRAFIPVSDLDETTFERDYQLNYK